MSKLVPELLVSDHAASRDFYVRIIGFSVRYERLAESPPISTSTARR